MKKILTYLVWFILLASGCQKPHQFCFFAQCPVQCIWLILFGDNDSDENYNIKASMSYMSKINHQIFKKGKSFSYLSFSIISLHSLSLASTSSTLPYLFPQFKGLPLLHTIFYFMLLCSSVYISSQDLYNLNQSIPIVNIFQWLVVALWTPLRERLWAK